MTWLKKLFKRVRDRLYRWLVPPYRTILVEESLPDVLRRGALYVVEEDGFQEQAAMLCPCGCKRVLHMNLLPDERPCWVLTQHDDGTATLHPSVWRKKDCGSHFWFRRGRVQWCKRTRRLANVPRAYSSVLGARGMGRDRISGRDAVWGEGQPNEIEAG